MDEISGLENLHGFKNGQNNFGVEIGSGMELRIYGEVDKLRIKDGKMENRTNHSRIEEFEDEGGYCYCYNLGCFVWHCN